MIDNSVAVDENNTAQNAGGQANSHTHVREWRVTDNKIRFKRHILRGDQKESNTSEHEIRTNREVGELCKVCPRSARE